MVDEKEDKLKLLKDLLLTDDTSFANKMTSRLEILEQKIKAHNQNLPKTVKPLVAEELEEFKREIPKTLGPTITQTIKQQIKHNQDEVVEAIFPIMGKMIKKYVAHEMELLKESIQQTTRSIFSFSSFKRKAKSTFTGIKEEDLILSDLAKTKIEEIFVIEKGSGIVQGHYSNRARVDKDMISGMLTAIKSFVEDAFTEGNESLEAISYELYTIHVQNFHKLYIAVVISGSYSIKFKEVLEGKLLDFSETLSKSGNTKTCDQLLTDFFENE